MKRILIIKYLILINYIIRGRISIFGQTIFGRWIVLKEMISILEHLLVLKKLSQVGYLQATMVKTITAISE